MESNQVAILEKVRPKLEYLEEQRQIISRQASRRTSRIFWISLVGVALLLIGINALWGLTGGVFLFVVVAGLGGALFYAHGQQAPADEAFQQTIGDAILEAAYPGWRFATSDHLPESRFEHLGIFSSYNRISGSNLMHGRHGDTDFAFSALRLDMKGNKTNTTVFEGLLVIADFPKRMKGKTLVFPDVAQQMLGNWMGKKMQEFGHKGMELVYLEDPVFEKQFSVYSTDQIEARYILTPAMMQNLLALSKEYGNHLTYCFTDGKVCIAIKHATSFQFKLHQRIHVEGMLQNFSQPIEIVQHVIDTLQLNTRIWGKE